MCSDHYNYNFSHNERGFAVIIVNKNFPKDSGMKNRRGWKRDMTRMKTLFRNLQFRVKCYKNLKGIEMIQKVHKGTYAEAISAWINNIGLHGAFKTLHMGTGELPTSESAVNWTFTATHLVCFKACSDKKNSDADCFACVISTHGTEEQEKTKHGPPYRSVYQHCVYGSDGMPVFINDILDIVQEDISPPLTGKPKLFFIQACRSRHDDSKPKYDYGVEISNKKQKTGTDDSEDVYQKTSDTAENGKAKGDFQSDDVNCDPSDWECVSDEEWNSDDTDSDSDPDSSDTEYQPPDQEDPRASPDAHKPPPLPVELVPINCPNDCLIMYPVTSGKIAFTNPSKGSYLLSYMYSKMDSLLERRELLPFLTEVVREAAKYSYNPEYKPDKMTVEEFHNCPLKTTACIVHRLTSDVVFIPKKNKPVKELLKDFIDDRISCVTGQ